MSFAYTEPLTAILPNTAYIEADMTLDKNDFGMLNPGQFVDTTSNPVSTAHIDDLVVANHILADQGIFDAFGHVSVRHEFNPGRFLLARNRAPGTVSAEDIIEFNLDGEALNSNGRSVYLERFVHSEIYRARPDVMAIVHSHSPAVLPFTVVKGTTLRPISHMCGFLGEGAPVFEISESAGDVSDLLIRNNALGRCLAETLSDASVVLMRGHGSTVVATSLKLAVYRAIYTEVNARVQLEAARLGSVTYLSKGEAESSALSTESQLERPWAQWKARVT